MWSQWYKVRSGLQWLFIITSVLLIGLFLYFSDRLVQSLEREEHSKMGLWADAYHLLLVDDGDADMSLILKIINENTTIPVFYTETDGTLLGSNNMVIPEDTATYISAKRKELTAKGNVFEIAISDDWKQYLYYDESILLQQLHYYPYIQLMVIVVFALLFYYMLMSRKRAEQNRIWVGLSKETAHQLGTPISSLMAWMDFLRNTETDTEIVNEMDKDIQRLHTVAERFSKIGSMPKLETTDLGKLIETVTVYMQKRASAHIHISASVPDETISIPLCAPLFAWVIENLCRNAIDALNSIRSSETDGTNNTPATTREGFIKIRLFTENEKIVIEAEDNGKGIPKKLQKDIFHAGFTTKKRGWGLGLTLVKRIVEEYHHGRIFVKSSTVGVGTTFRIEL